MTELTPELRIRIHERIQEATGLISQAEDELPHDDVRKQLHAGAVRAEADADRSRSESAGSTPAPRSIDAAGDGQPEGEPPTGADDQPVETPSTSVSPPPLSSTALCPDCGRGFAVRGLNIHRAKAHGIPGPTHGRPGPAAREKAQRSNGSPVTDDPTEPHLGDFVREDRERRTPRKESYLCSQCPESFPNVGKLNEHLLADHPPEPRRLPRSELERMTRTESARVLHPGAGGGLR